MRCAVKGQLDWTYTTAVFYNNTASEVREREDAEVLQVRRLRVGEQAEPLCAQITTSLDYWFADFRNSIE
jgi:hypothetical protein